MNYCAVFDVRDFLLSLGVSSIGLSSFSSAARPKQFSYIQTGMLGKTGGLGGHGPRLERRVLNSDEFHAA